MVAGLAHLFSLVWLTQNFFHFTLSVFLTPPAILYHITFLISMAAVTDVLPTQRGHPAVHELGVRGPSVEDCLYYITLSTHTHTHTHIHTHTHAYACMRMCTRKHTCTRTHAHAHAHAGTHHTRTHTHTHARARGGPHIWL
jgi:hypothetical protein